MAPSDAPDTYAISPAEMMAWAAASLGAGAAATIGVSYRRVAKE